jgi:hypothetical protein
MCHIDAPKMHKAPERLSCGAAIELNDLKLVGVATAILLQNVMMNSRICRTGQSS